MSAQEAFCAKLVDIILFNINFKITFIFSYCKNVQLKQNMKSFCKLRKYLKLKKHLFLFTDTC